MPIEIQIPGSLGSLSPVEELLWSGLLTSSQSPECKIHVAATTEDRGVRAEFLRWYLIAAIPSVTPSPTSIEITGATITGKLNLTGLVTGVSLQFSECVFSDAVQLSDSTVGGFEMLGGRAGEITGDRFIVNGPMKFTSKDLPASLGPTIKKLRINGAEVRGKRKRRRGKWPYVRLGRGVCRDRRHAPMGKRLPKR
jgi:hypothetical protein